MRVRGLLALTVLAIVGCRTHTVDDCRLPCDDDDRAYFAACVASGNDDDPTQVCEAGNRRCCALTADCLGDLDDQTVVTSVASCIDVTATNCDRPCDDADEVAYEGCVAAGSATCASGDETCCGLEAGCLGSLGDLLISADGCCSDASDCPASLSCDPSTWTCGGAPAGCGDGTQSATEECDDANMVTESCSYGAMSCTVCDASCHSVAGATRRCGDGTIDLSDGEECEPPDDPSICDASCHSLQPASCTNQVQDGTESDVDCGGSTCAACRSAAVCTAQSDCRALFPACRGLADCTGTVTSPGVCVETTSCDDGDSCTDDPCDASGACTMHTPIDRDHDGDGPHSGDCGLDCNDADPDVYGGAAELCDRIDNDCDTLVDESCT